jgi:hypothetical protein
MTLNCSHEQQHGRTEITFETILLFTLGLRTRLTELIARTIGNIIYSQYSGVTCKN